MSALIDDVAVDEPGQHDGVLHAVANVVRRLGVGGRVVLPARPGIVRQACHAADAAGVELTVEDDGPTFSIGFTP